MWPQNWNDNTILLGYSEWENKKAFLESVKSKKAKPLKEYIQENVRATPPVRIQTSKSCGRRPPDSRAV